MPWQEEIFSEGDGSTSDEEFVDDLEEAKRISLLEYRSSANGQPVAGPSSVVNGSSRVYEADLRNELSRVESEIYDARAKLELLLAQKTKILKNLQEHRKTVAAAEEEARNREPAVNYMDDFDWTPALKTTMKRVFSINDFRLCQKGVCNANMDGRDIICVMPTGGGKSLTYQLPAIMTAGCTIVVSPLISLMADQVHHMLEAGVDAVMITSATTKEDKREIYRRFDEMVQGRGKDKDVKLCYITPERMAKDKTFLSKLQRLSEAKKLARVVIDEAHCISQMGHDYRADYRKLSTVRQLFPGVPIQALSATCPPAVREDIIKILGLKPLSHGTAAKRNRTVYFTSPLYRKNLHYRVLQKPDAKSAVLRNITDYILENHAHDSGIIYCFTVNETEDVAAGIGAASNGKIKTGVYHARIDDAQRMRLHEKWRKGEVQVVCATIAFGLGIDKGNVRFVIHHSMSKALDGFYQESGRAGRDGLDADCVLYYRHQDAFRIRGVTCAETDSNANLREMARFALELEQCRKIHFAKYFAMSANLNAASWSTEDEDAMTPCGHCDNCTRAPETIDCKDVTAEAWKILRVAEYVTRHQGRVTLNQLALLARGAGKGEFGLSQHAAKSASSKAALDLQELCGGPIKLSREYTETLTMHLYLNGYLNEDIQVTAYATNIYLKPHAKARDLLLHSLGAVEQGIDPRIICTFLGKPKRASGKQRRNAEQPTSDDDQAPIRGSSTKKRKARIANLLDADDADEDFTNQIRDVDAILEDDMEDDWGSTLRPQAHAAKRIRRSGKSTSGKRTSSHRTTTAHEVIELSSD